MSAPTPPPSAFSTAAVQRGADWLSGQGADADVVVSSRVRLARNLAGLPFLTKASSAQRQEILRVCRARLLSCGIAEKMLWVDVHNAPKLDRTLMLERHLISKEHAKGVIPGGKSAEKDDAGDETPEVEAAPARGVAVSLPDENVSIMVNEEDHLRLQVLLSGLELSRAFAEINRVDDLIEGTVPASAVAPRAGGPCAVEGAPPVTSLTYAFSPRFGYLTACPTNLGTGIRVSVMLHLPALKMTGEMDKVRRATRDMSLAVRGYYGEGTEAAGEFYQISNQTTLGKPESMLLHEFEHEIIPQVISYERAARKVLLDKRKRLLEDKVFRALGTLRFARLLTPEESLSLLSDVRLGIVTGLIKGVSAQEVNQLILLTQPAHLQRVLGREMDQNQRREARADMVREKLAV